MNTDSNQKRFLIKNSHFFISSISEFYPLTKKLLAKYCQNLFLDRLGQNCEVDWTKEFFELYLNIFQPKGIDSFWFSVNEKLPWSVEFIKRFEQHLNWEGLSQNYVILKSPAILAEFEEQLRPHFSKRLKRAPQEMMLAPSEHNISKYEENRCLLYSTEEEIDQDPDAEWKDLSLSEFLPWSMNLIKKYEDKWDWQILSCNSDIEWTPEMIEEFKDKIHWKGFEEDNSSNFSFYHYDEWDLDFIRKYKNYIDWALLCHAGSSSIWNIDFLIEFESYLYFENLACNAHVWNSSFGDLTDQDIESLLSDEDLVAEAHRQAEIIRQHTIEFNKRMDEQNGL